MPNKFSVPIFVVGNKYDLLKSNLPEDCGVLELADMIFPDLSYHLHTSYHQNQKTSQHNSPVAKPSSISTSSQNLSSTLINKNEFQQQVENFNKSNNCYIEKLFTDCLYHDYKDTAHLKLCLDKSRQQMNKLSQVLTGLQEMVVSAKDGGEDMLNLWINLVQIHISPKPIFISAGTRCEDEEGPKKDENKPEK